MEKLVYLVGAGPGAADLLTLRAVRILEGAKAILYDRLVNPDILAYCPASAYRLCVGKEKGNHHVPQERIHELLLTCLEEHSTVIRLKGGDPSIFSRMGEEIEFLKSHGVRCEVVPGITAALGSAASLGFSLTHRDHASRLIFHTGHSRDCKNRQKSKNENRLRKEDLEQTTHVFYMSITRMEQICQELVQGTSDHSIPALIVERTTCPEQRSFLGTLGTIASIAKEQNVSSPAILIIGNTLRQLYRSQFKISSF